MIYGTFDSFVLIWFIIKNIQYIRSVYLVLYIPDRTWIDLSTETSVDRLVYKLYQTINRHTRIYYTQPTFHRLVYM